MDAASVGGNFKNHPSDANRWVAMENLQSVSRQIMYNEKSQRKLVMKNEEQDENEFNWTAIKIKKNKSKQKVSVPDTNLRRSIQSLNDLLQKIYS